MDQDVDDLVGGRWWETAGMPSVAMLLADWHAAYERHGMKALDARVPPDRGKIGNQKEPVDGKGAGKAHFAASGMKGGKGKAAGWNLGFRPASSKCDAAIIKMLADLQGKPVTKVELQLLLSNPPRFKRKRIEDSLYALAKRGCISRTGPVGRCRYYLPSPVLEQGEKAQP
jgi:hypothetical protein